MRLPPAHDVIFPWRQSIHQTLIMECAWLLRQQLPSDEAFRQFVAAKTWIDPKTALLMAETWEIARKCRVLREFANRDPDGAMHLVGQMDECERAQLAGADPTMAQLLTLRPKRQREALRRLRLLSGAAV